MHIRTHANNNTHAQICWNEDFGYYTADVTEKTCANSYGPGCFVDQVRAPHDQGAPRRTCMHVAVRLEQTAATVKLMQQSVLVV